MKFCMGKKAPYKNCLKSGIRRHKMIHELGQGCHCANCGIHAGENPQLHHEDFFAGDKRIMSQAQVQARIPPIVVRRYVDNVFNMR